MMTASLRTNVRPWVVALVAAVGFFVAQSESAAAEVGPPTNTLSWRARVLAPVEARVAPDVTARRVTTVQPVAPFSGGPMILLVLERRVVGEPGAETEWVRLLLPKRPNGLSGWVPSDYLRLASNTKRIVIDQSDRRTYVYDSGKLVLSVRNAVGKSATPTPNGRFAIAEKISTPPRGFLGPAVLVTTGYSPTLNEYAGGNGRFAMHGTSLPGLLGTRASHGCIRHRNDNILRIARIVGEGTPITIRP